MKKNLLHNERGELSVFTIFAVLAVNMILGFVLLFATIKINCMNIRNAAKMELNNVSARIYADTFHSQREANLDSYMGDLNLSAAYQSALRSGFVNGLEQRIELSNDNYEIRNISLQFSQQSGKIVYTVTCDAIFQIRMFGTFFPPIIRHITLTGSHNTKY